MSRPSRTRLAALERRFGGRAGSIEAAIIALHELEEARKRGEGAEVLRRLEDAALRACEALPEATKRSLVSASED